VKCPTYLSCALELEKDLSFAMYHVHTTVAASMLDALSVIIADMPSLWPAGPSAN
jgi:hypothetical protein